MPKGSEALTNARKEEIVDACAALYETMGFRDITIRDIGAKTSFTRTSIYNYFQTKEEIFLALLQREHEVWIADLEALASRRDKLSTEQFADALARTLEKRGCMLKLMSMNLYDMERNSRLENLVAFKQAYADTLSAIRTCLNRFFPAMEEKEIRDFLYSFFPFLFGVYPYTTSTEKQRQAMEAVGVEVPRCTIYDLTKPLVEKLLKASGERHRSAGGTGKEEIA